MCALLQGQLKALIDRHIKDYYEKEYQGGISDMDALGVMISVYFEWDGVRILDAMQAALQDANFHSINEKIDAIREAEKLYV